MKFWEFADTFRGEPGIIKQVLKQTEWWKYYKHYKRLGEIINNQERHILDEELPFDLCYEVALKSKKDYWHAYLQQPQLLFSYKPAIEELEWMTSSEAMVRFGGRKLFEAHDGSYTEVQPKHLGSQVEVIGSYNLTSIGLVAILRTEDKRSLTNCILSTQDDAYHWEVTGEDKLIFIDPYEAYIKKEMHRAQHVLDWKLACMGHKEKPKPGAILNCS